MPDRYLDSLQAPERASMKAGEGSMAKIVRHGRVQDTDDGLSEFPHVVLNQARVHDFFLDVMRKSPSRLEPYYAYTAEQVPEARQFLEQRLAEINNNYPGANGTLPWMKKV